MNLPIDYAERLFQSSPSNFTRYMLFRLTDIHQRKTNNLAELSLDVSNDPRRKPLSEMKPSMVLAGLMAARDVIQENLIKEDPIFVDTMAESLKNVETAFD